MTISPRSLISGKVPSAESWIDFTADTSFTPKSMKAIMFEARPINVSGSAMVGVVSVVKRVHCRRLGVLGVMRHNEA